MRGFIYIGLFFLVAGCKKEISESDLNLLNGYWEIARVTFPDGNQKEYNVNTSIDYISVKNNEGFRKKVQPKLDGTFDTSDDAIPFTVKNTENKFFLRYENGQDEWNEELVELSDTHFSIKNEESLVYKYKRFEAINIDK